MNGVVAWLESAEGQEWRERAMEPAAVTFGHLLPADFFSTAWMRARGYGPVDAAHDPCGRPPLREAGA